MDKLLTTYFGYSKLLNDIKKLKEIDIPSNVQDIQVSASYGDLTENAEYEAATERQGFLVSRLHELQVILSNTQLIDPSIYTPNKISFGLTFKIIDIDTEEENVFTLVGGYESNPSKNKISYNSPFAKLFLGKKIGDEVETNFNGEKKYYEIVDIWYDEKILQED